MHGSIEKATALTTEEDGYRDRSISRQVRREADVTRDPLTTRSEHAG